MLEKGEASLNRVLRWYKKNCAKHKRVFDLSREEFKTLTSGDCFYCGIKPDQVAKNGKKSTPYIYNGVDRVDNKQGYSVSNCVSCCGRCNLAKRGLTLDQYIQKCKEVVWYQEHKANLAFDKVINES